MAICAACGRDVRPRIQINGNMERIGVCPYIECRAGMPLDGVAERPPPPDVIPPADSIDPVVRALPKVEPKKAAKLTPAQVAESCPDIIELAKNRLAELNRELEKLEGFRREAARLERMIHAAEESEATVVPLRSAATN